MSLVVDLIGQRSRDVIGRLSVRRKDIGCEDCKSDWCTNHFTNHRHPMTRASMC